MKVRIQMPAVADPVLNKPVLMPTAEPLQFTIWKVVAWAKQEPCAPPPDGAGPWAWFELVLEAMDTVTVERGWMPGPGQVHKPSLPN